MANEPSMTGHWHSVPPFPLGLTVELILEQDEQKDIKGAGTISAPGEPPAPVKVIPPSRNSYPQVVLTISSPDFGNITFQGSFSNSNTVCGQYEDSGKGCIRRD